ncbi:MAG: GIY-YIG nuclease family protein [Bacteroidota bacterium]
MKNYAGEVIPSTQSLIEEAEKICNQLTGGRKFAWHELYQEKAEKNNTTAWNRIKPITSCGLYVFYNAAGQAVYVGNSRDIPTRLRNLFLGKEHNVASLVYLILRDRHDAAHGDYMGERKDLPGWEQNREAMQEKMRNDWRIQFLPPVS